MADGGKQDADIYLFEEVIIISDFRAAQAAAVSMTT
jgi:hypothetical protein